MRTEQTIVNKYVVTAGVTAYSVTFPLYETTDVAVHLSKDGGVTESLLTLGTDYSVTIAADNKSGTVTLANGVAAAGDILALVSDLPLTQELDLSGVSTVDVEATETQLDRDCQQRQQLAEEVSRAIKVPVTSPKTGDELWADFWEAYADIHATEQHVEDLYNNLAIYLNKGAVFAQRYIEEMAAPAFGTSVNNSTTQAIAYYKGYIYRSQDCGTGLHKYNFVNKAQLTRYPFRMQSRSSICYVNDSAAVQPAKTWVLQGIGHGDGFAFAEDATGIDYLYAHASARAGLGVDSIAYSSVTLSGNATDGYTVSGTAADDKYIAAASAIVRDDTALTSIGCPGTDADAQSAGYADLAAAQADYTAKRAAYAAHNATVDADIELSASGVIRIPWSKINAAEATKANPYTPQASDGVVWYRYLPRVTNGNFGMSTDGEWMLFVDRIITKDIPGLDRHTYTLTVTVYHRADVESVPANASGIADCSNLKPYSVFSVPLPDEEDTEYAESGVTSDGTLVYFTLCGARIRSTCLLEVWTLEGRHVSSMTTGTIRDETPSIYKTGFGATVTAVSVAEDAGSSPQAWTETVSETDDRGQTNVWTKTLTTATADIAVGDAVRYLPFRYECEGLSFKDAKLLTASRYLFTRVTGATYATSVCSWRGQCFVWSHQYSLWKSGSDYVLKDSSGNVKNTLTSVPRPSMIAYWSPTSYQGEEGSTVTAWSATPGSDGLIWQRGPHNFHHFVTAFLLPEGAPEEWGLDADVCEKPAARNEINPVATRRELLWAYNALNTNLLFPIMAATRLGAWYLFNATDILADPTKTGLFGARVLTTDNSVDGKKVIYGTTSGSSCYSWVFDETSGRAVLYVDGQAVLIAYNTHTRTNGNFYPSSHQTDDIGKADKQYKGVYARDFYRGGQNAFPQFSATPVYDVTLAEDTITTQSAPYTITAEQMGGAYTHLAIYLKATAGNAVAPISVIATYGDVTNVATITNGIHTSARNTIVYVMNFYGQSRITYANGGAGNASLSQYISAPSPTFIGTRTISAFTMYVSDTVPIPAGTRITIYAAS